MNPRKASARSSQRVGPAIDFEASEPSADRVVTGGRAFRIGQPLIKTTPSSGWNIPVKVKELSYTISAASAHDAFTKVREYLTQNGIILDATQIWFHLNRYWLPRTPVNSRVVSPDALDTINKEPVYVLVEKDGYGPAFWGRLLWSVAGLYLAVTEEEYLEGEMREIYAPWNHVFLRKESIGCEECSSHWVEEYAQADLSTLALAREFFVDIQNKIRAKQERAPLTFAEAAKNHHWK